VPGIHGRHGSKDTSILQVGHQITSSSRINIHRFVHVSDGEPIELVRPNGSKHRHPSTRLIVVTDLDRFWDLLNIGKGRVKVIKDADIVIIRRACNTGPYVRGKKEILKDWRTGRLETSNPVNKRYLTIGTPHCTCHAQVMGELRQLLKGFVHLGVLAKRPNIPNSHRSV